MSNGLCARGDSGGQTGCRCGEEARGGGGAGGGGGHTAGAWNRLRLLRKRAKSSEHMSLAWRVEGTGQARIGCGATCLEHWFGTGIACATSRNRGDSSPLSNCDSVQFLEPFCSDPSDRVPASLSASTVSLSGLSILISFTVFEGLAFDHIGVIFLEEVEVFMMSANP